MSTRVAPPTEDEVLAALEKATVREWDGQQDWQPAGRVDVADYLARARGWDGALGLDRTPAGHQPTRATAIGKYVSVKAIQEVLEILDAQGKAYGFYGRHTFITRRYGITPGHVYYLSQRALDLLLHERRNDWASSAEAKALHDAQQAVLKNHEDEVEHHRKIYLADQLAAEPDWHAMLNDDDEEKG